MNISVFGLGYVGCISLGCLAQSGHKVIGVDISKPKVDLINRGLPTIIERGMTEIFSQQRKEGRISATTDGVGAVKETDVSFICVGTPSGKNGHTDVTSVLKVVEEIAQGIGEKDTFHIVVIRSTVAPGTNEQTVDIIERISGRKRNQDFAVVSNPEFMREGTAIRDYRAPALTLVGTTSNKAIEIMREIYSEINAPFVVTDVGVAELIKYVNNAFHAVKISFANEIGNICKKLGVDSHKLMEIFCLDKKLNLSPYYLKPGFAYGGSCLPKDLKALRTIAHDLYAECPVLESIERSNDLQKDILLNNVLSAGKQRIGFLGLSFKAGTDDLRNSPIVDVIEQLLGKGFDVRIFDRNVCLGQLVGTNREYILEKIPLISRFITDDVTELIERSEIIVVVNNEEEFKNILEKTAKDTIIYDLVNINFKNRDSLGTYNGIAW
jgi:GDP-mannose 6-dehydrogenase